MAQARVHPPVVDLGRRLGWSPLPLSVRDARRRAGDLRERLDAARRFPASTSSNGSANPAQPEVSVSSLTVRRGTTYALRNLELRLERGSVTAVMGRNGAGKSTLLGAIAGQFRPTRGRVRLGAVDPVTTSPAQLVSRVGLVPQDPDVLLYADSVAFECADADADLGLPAGTTRAVLADLAPDVDDAQHPRDLSEGQRLCLALAVILGRRPDLVLLDEPTRGLDYPAKHRLTGILRELARSEHTVVVATHDVELAAEVADRVVVLADGEVVADGPAREILAGSPAFAPQVAKILHPLPYLTVTDVIQALGAAS
jgi:energy-coupling factor transport system ATP-binding protein